MVAGVASSPPLSPIPPRNRSGNLQSLFSEARLRFSLLLPPIMDPFHRRPLEFVRPRIA